MADSKDVSGICGMPSCGKTTDRKPHLECQICFKVFHTACLGKAWSDITTVNELKKVILLRTGLRWYCSNCEPKIRDYVHSTEISSALLSVDSRIEGLTKLICNNHQALTKTYSAQVSSSPSTSNTPNTDDIQQVRKLVQNVDTTLRAQSLAQDKLSRSMNIVIHNLVERNDTMTSVTDACQNIHFSKYLITQVTRIGQRNMDKSNNKPRPTKIAFSSAIHRDEFLKRYNNWEGRGITFCTPDHDKAERDREFALRQQRNELQLSNTDNYYQVRNGAIYFKPKYSGRWGKLRLPTDPISSSDTPPHHNQSTTTTPPSSSQAGASYHPSTPYHSVSSSPENSPSRLEEVLIKAITPPSC